MPSPPPGLIPPKCAAEALAHCIRYIKHEYVGIGLLGVVNGLPRDKCTIARKTLDPLAAGAGKPSDADLGQPPGDGPDRDEPKVRFVKDDELINRLRKDVPRRLLITGEGGMGKTEYTRLIALRLAENFRADPTAAKVPIRVTLADRIAEKDCDAGGALLANHLAPNEHHWLTPYLKANRVTFCIDGLDELPFDATRSRRFFAELFKFIGQHAGCTFIVAGRPGSLPDALSSSGLFDKSTHHELQPLTDPDLRHYVTGYFAATAPPADAAGLTAGMLAAVAAGRSSLRPLIYTPFMLALACKVYHKDRQVPANPADLFDRGIRDLLHWRRSRGTTRLPRSDTLCLEALSTLAAFAMAAPAPENAVRLRFPVHEAHGWLADHAKHLVALDKSLDGDDGAIDDLLDRLAPASGVLVRAGDGDLRFTNRVAAEFLAARWVCRHGYPGWPYAKHEYTPVPTGPDIYPATAGRDQQVMDWLGDHAWTDQRAALVQAVRFELARVEPVAVGQPQPKAGVAVALRAIHWLNDAIEPFFVRSADALSVRTTLVHKLFRSLQALPGDRGQADDNLRGLVRSRLDSPDEWWKSEFDVELASSLPSFQGKPFRDIAIASLKADLAGNGDAIESLPLALAAGFGGDPKALDALRRAMRTARADPAGKGFAIGYLVEALAAGFGGDPKALDALRRAMRAARADPARNWSKIGYLAEALAAGFGGDPKALDTLRRAMRAARADPAGNDFAIKSLARALASGFGGNPKALDALRRAMRAARANPAGNSHAIGPLAHALASGFGGNPKALDALRRAMRAARADPMWNAGSIGSLASALASGFGGDPQALNALRRAMRAARADSTGNNRAIWSLARALAVGFGDDPKALDALRWAMRAAGADPGGNGGPIWSPAEALAARFGGDPVAAVNILLADQAGELEVEQWRPFVVLQGPRAALEDWAGPSGKLWGLTGTKLIIHDLDPNEPVDIPSQRRAVLVAPREQIRRGLPRDILSFGDFDGDDVKALVEWLDRVGGQRGLADDHPIRRITRFLSAIVILVKVLPLQSKRRVLWPTKKRPDPDGRDPEDFDKLSIYGLLQRITDGSGQSRPADWPYSPVAQPKKRSVATPDVVTTTSKPNGVTRRSPLPNAAVLADLHRKLWHSEREIGLRFGPRIIIAIDTLFAALGVQDRSSRRKPDNENSDRTPADAPSVEKRGRNPRSKRRRS